MSYDYSNEADDNLETIGSLRHSLYTDICRSDHNELKRKLCKPKCIKRISMNTNQVKTMKKVENKTYLELTFVTDDSTAIKTACSSTSPTNVQGNRVIYATMIEYEYKPVEKQPKIKLQKDLPKFYNRSKKDRRSGTPVPKCYR